jgi:hypothetical protein
MAAFETRFHGKDLTMRNMLIGGAIAAILVATPGLAQRSGQTRAEAIAMADKQFARFDTNGDGALDKTEIDAMMQARAARSGQPANPSASQTFLHHNDKDGNGAVSKAEFETAAGARFDAKDANKNGVIDAGEAGAEG